MQILLELQSGFAGGIGQRLDPSVIDVAAAVEHDFLDPFGLGALGNAFADVLRRSQVASGPCSPFLPSAEFAETRVAPFKSSINCT